ncbi:MAG TPA: alpha-mannosidase [Micromonosporaceae bacterium]|nr:alpha-mannosidase [Micromonosporaceae bacterium]
MSVRTVQSRLLAIGLFVGILVAPGTAAQAAPSEPAPTATAVPGAAQTAAAVVEDPTNLASPDEKVKAARAIGINPDVALLVQNDQGFVFALWERPEAGTYVKAEALRAYRSDDRNAAYDFIVRGIFVAVADDAQAKILADAAQARRRSVAVAVGLDPSETALVEKGDRDFIFSVWQRVTAGSHVWAAARDAIADGTDQDDWNAFLDTGAQAAVEQDLRDAISKADKELAAKLRAEQLANAKKSLLQLLLLPVPDELVAAPNRQYVLHVHNNAKGLEVSLASQVALNAPDASLEQALSDFIFTGGAAANKRDEDAAAARELAGYRDRVIVIRDAAKHDGFQPTVVVAAQRALAENTLLGLQTFLLKGQDEARAKDRRLDFGTGFEPGDSRPNWQNTIDAAVAGRGGMANVGGITSTLTTSELGVRPSPVAHSGGNVLMYSGMDNNGTRSFAYNQAYAMSKVSVRPTTQLSYWIYPQSSTQFTAVAGGNSTCVAVDLIFSDGTNLRDSAARDQRGNGVHPGKQCGKLTLDAWNEVVVNVGAVAAGKSILRITVGYDQPANTGGYRGFVDDLKLTDLESAPQFRTSAEAGETRLSWTNSADVGDAPRGGLINVGPIVSTATGPELLEGVTTGRTGTKVLLYSGKDASTTRSHAYMKAYALSEAYVSAGTQLSYWVYPQSTKAFGSVTGSNSSCVAIDLILEDKMGGAITSLRDSGVKDQRGNGVHPGKQCGKLPLDTWTQVVVPLGAVANGKRIAQIDIGYDQVGNTGGYRGFIDDIRITQ